jgi:uncharacterized lipoprotein YmbA
LRHIIEAAAIGAFLLLCACASEPDHFYTLNILPADARSGPTSPTVHVLLSVDVPALVDRPQMVLRTSDNGIAVLDHQRWAVPLSDQVLQTLARDIESRRSGLLVGDRGFDRGGAAPVTIKVDIVRLSARLAGDVLMEAHWRIVDASAGIDDLGSDVFNSPVDGADYAAVARAYSRVLSALADKLTEVIPPR